MRCNLKYCMKQCKEVAYFALRLSVEYGIWMCNCVVWTHTTTKKKDKNRRATRMVTNDHGLHSSVIAMLTQLGYFRTAPREPTSNHDVQSSTWTGGSTNYSTYSCTRSNHNFKFCSIGSNSTPVTIQIFILPTINSYLESPPNHDHRSHVSRCIQASASIAPPHWITSIGGISHMGVCQLSIRTMHMHMVSAQQAVCHTHFIYTHYTRQAVH